MVDLFSEFAAYVKRYALIQPGDGVVVGVSGGPDSVALLDLLVRLAPEWKLRLLVAHLHHGIRGEDADADAEFVAVLADRYELPYISGREDVPALAQAERRSVEETARRVRYDFLARTARAQGARLIAVGHHLDDQAETVLMHWLRGAGPAGLRGMLPATPFQLYRLLPQSAEVQSDVILIRPLLGLTRAQIVAYCEMRALQSRLDRSNLDTTLFRNRLRHEVLPYLETLNPGLPQRLSHLAEIVRADYELLEQLVEQRWQELQRVSPAGTLTLDLAGFRAAPLSLQRALLRRMAYQLRPTFRDVDFHHVENAVDISCRGGTGMRATLPQGVELVIGYDTLTMTAADQALRPPDQPWLEPGTILSVAIPGETALPEGWEIQAEILTAWDQAAIVANADPWTAWCDAESLVAPVVVRTRLRGERWQPQGLGAELNLGDFLVNAKVPRDYRDRWPLLVSGERILWVMGVRLSEAVLVRPTTRTVVRVRLQRR